ncbi:FitA-like ribbon-helix-helix domain-containing protein [Allopusillimonas ginsengisoli]|uniref:FitA-like ribbon-helix-helix domain-containing protein n=1 Tax=Allopusillimonas ginsengisoli TaxID=453575 RepID=UPI0010C1E36A|nr:Arc family DNA-binding protein [Allopusillimonas ginsengisoli]
MRSVTVRNVPEEVDRAIRVRTAQHGRSIKAEMRYILESAIRPEGRVELGSLMSEIGRQVKLTRCAASLGL